MDKLEDRKASEYAQWRGENRPIEKRQKLGGEKSDQKVSHKLKEKRIPEIQGKFKVCCEIQTKDKN